MLRIEREKCNCTNYQKKVIENAGNWKLVYCWQCGKMQSLEDYREDEKPKKEKV